MSGEQRVGHTPGPWVVNPVEAWVELPGQDAPITALCWPTDLRSEDETFANARLIAAAPDLLEALSEVRDWILNWCPEFVQDDEWPATAAKIQAGIAKARGRELGSNER